MIAAVASGKLHRNIVIRLDSDSVLHSVNTYILDIDSNKHPQSFGMNQLH
jgi:hypothetical protein